MAAPVIIVKEGSCVIEIHRKGGGPNSLLASITVPEAGFQFAGSRVDFDNKSGGPQPGQGGKLEYVFEFHGENPAAGNG